MFSCPYNHDPIGRILDWIDDYWYSNNVQNSWFCLHFVHSKILLSGCRLRTYSQNERPSGCQLEASNNGTEWVLVDERNDELNNSQAENSFSCQTSKIYSYFKFTQTKVRLTYND
jgi:hypothetical protein